MHTHCYWLLWCQGSEQMKWVVLGQCVFLGKRPEFFRYEEPCLVGMRPVFIVSTKQWCSVLTLFWFLLCLGAVALCFPHTRCGNAAGLQKHGDARMHLPYACW